MNTKVDALEADFKTLAAEHNAVDWTTERGYILQAMEANWKLQKATDISLRNAILNIAKTGISISPLEGLAYLEVRAVNTETDKKKPAVWRNDAALKIGYKGMITALVDCGAVNWMRADVVRSGDQFEYRGPAAMPVVKITDPFGATRRDILGPYAIAELPSGQVFCEILRPEEIAAIKAASGVENGPWKSFEPEMMKKSALNRLGKTIPRKAGSRADSIINATLAGDAPDFEFEQPEAKAPPVVFTEDQQTAFHTAVKDKDGFALLAMSQELERDAWAGLFKTAPEGTAVKFKDNVRALMAEARTVIEATHKELIARMEADDTHGAIEILDETPWQFIAPHSDNTLTAWVEQQVKAA